MTDNKNTIDVVLEARMDRVLTQPHLQTEELDQT